MNQIAVENITFSYNKDKVIENLSLYIEEGDFVCILGESGCGKSTLLRLMAGLNHPDCGTIKSAGTVIQKPCLERGVVFQDYGLYPWFTTGKNIMLSMKQKFPNKNKTDLKNEILHSLKQVGLDETIYNKYPHELSGGMRQRCAICRSFALDPPVLLMDEPFGALDAVTRFRLQNMVRDLWVKEDKKRKTVVFVTHDVEEAMYLATKIYVLGMKPSKVIYSYEFQDKHKKEDRNELFQKPEYTALRKALMDALNNDIEERVRNNEEKSNSTASGM